ncbi:MAG: OmpA family protein [Limnochordaceae bacterium]|nr:OmpA family protein [Limnochordaceae bacterium]
MPTSRQHRDPRPVPSAELLNSHATSHGAAGGGGHDGAGMMRWLLTYADLITLLMAFFVVMYALSRVDLVRYQKLASSLQGALGYGGSGGGGSPGKGGGAGLDSGLGGASPDANPPASPAPNTPVQPWAELERQVQTVARELEAAGLVQVRIQTEGMSVLISDVALFPTASAELTPSAQSLLKKLVPVLRPLPNLLQIRGYTDDRPIRTPEYPSNWELSLARAVSVLRLLVQSGIPVERLSAAGFGPLYPVASNATPAGRARNRRVEIVVLQTPAAQVTTPRSAPASAGSASTRPLPPAPGSPSGRG